MVFCTYKRRSLWKGYFFGRKFYDFVVDYEQGVEALIFSRSMVFLPCLVSRTYTFYTGFELVQGTISKRRVRMKVGQISMTKDMGSRIHRTIEVRKGRNKNFKNKPGKFFTKDKNKKRK